jgi:hypothetical protein
MLPILLPKRVVRQTARNPRQVSTQNVNGNSRNHEYGTDPKSPVTMHALPVWARIWFTTIAAISFAVVFATGHLFSIFRISEQCLSEKHFMM